MALNTFVDTLSFKKKTQRASKFKDRCLELEYQVLFYLISKTIVMKQYQQRFQDRTFTHELLNIVT